MSLAKPEWRRLVIFSLFAFISIFLAGCSTTSGGPRASYNIEEDIKQISDRFKPLTAVSQFYTNETKAKRNEPTTARLVLANLEYLKWLREINAEKQGLDTATDVLILSLNLAATAVGGAPAKTVLSAISAGTAGSKVAFDKHYFYEKTVPALIAAMNAQRKVVLAKILEGLEKDLVEYPFLRGLDDINDYCQAGTFAGALTAIQVDAGVKEKK